MLLYHVYYAVAILSSNGRIWKRKRDMKRKVLAGAGAAVVIMAACVLAVRLAGGGKTEPAMDTSAVVRTQIVENGTLSSESTYVGIISAEGTARVVFMVSGTVEGIHVSVGDRVEEKQPLCDMDDESGLLGLENAKQNYETVLAGYGGEGLSLVQGQLQIAQNQYNRYRILFEAGGYIQGRT